tara:strand:- start:126 stop:827 length:702 start_codon:yes stop_codon:yes gene_type:complete
MKLFTQNKDLKKTGVFGWTLPAHWVTLTNGTKFNTCPNAGVCAAFCYAKNGTFMFSNVRKAHTEKLELVLNNREKWIELINEELKLKKYINKFIRIHDAGDFFSEQYAIDWINFAKENPQCIFYTYTKEVKLFKNIGALPENFIVIYSYGGRQDNLINKETDRHSDVFPNYEEMINAGYNDITNDDSQAAINENFKVGLYRNNIKHFIKKMGDKKFSEWQNGDKPIKNQTKLF